ncbi:MAG: NAD(P)H-dependent oxidoreductase subunit E [Elusimicrobia bacterium]|nr:NAD(P)H-dependent oxidoreductase subunit E [Elusimicrobiota bacterium]
MSPDGNGKKKLCVCCGAGCVSSGSLAVADALKAALRDEGLDKETTVVPVGCIGACNQGPLVKVSPENTIYQKVAPDDLKSLVRTHLVNGQVFLPSLLFADKMENPPADAYENAFFKKQRRIVLENCGSINPESLEDYLAAGGYQALRKAVTEMSREEVIAEIKQSGLRGRGGAGYPTGLKWEMVYKSINDTKYVICNGDEGDPGAFMDRSVLEGDPHRVLEGMAIAAYAIGAQKGYVYVRAEYPLAIKSLEAAIKSGRRKDIFGKSVFGSDFQFDVEIRVGAGAFVCGEETALMASIEGKRGTPRPRPPYPAESGLWGKPTLINNVETFASIAPIVMNGGEWYGSIGTPKSAGTKTFALAGKINNTGLIEVPLGITLREVIFEIGGGIPGGKKFKAAQTGGPSGGCIPEQFLDTPLDYESLASLGSIMGSGGLIVMDETSCMVDVARFFMEFCMDESCGKCVPCRVGTKQMFDLLSRITDSSGTDSDLALLEELATYVKETSLCGLGATAPNPLVSTLRYFRDEYVAHIRDKRCPAGVCVMAPAAP